MVIQTSIKFGVFVNAIQKLVYSPILPQQTSEAWLFTPKKPNIHQTDRSAMLSAVHYAFLSSFTVVSCYSLKWWIIFLSSQGSSAMLKHYGQTLFAVANSFVINRKFLRHLKRLVHLRHQVRFCLQIHGQMLTQTKLHITSTQKIPLLSFTEF